MADERLPSLARELSSQFDEDRRDREPLEKRWLEDYRLYMGIYDPDIEAGIREGRSKLFMRQAKVKTDTVVARLMDILFPRAGDRNWDLQPTPEPTLDATFMASVDSVRLSDGEDAARQVLTEEAAKRSAAMSRVVADQLAESPDHVGYRATIREVVRSAVLYGMGIHKGPLVDERTRKQWTSKRITTTDASGQTVETESWVLDQSPVGLRPYFRPVSVWNFFWDMTAKELKGCRRVWEEYLMVYGDVLDLARRGGFFGDVIRAYLAKNRDGDAQERTYEAELRRLGDKNNERQLKNRFRVLERWGWLRGDELVACGVDLGSDPVEEDYFCNVWLLGDQIIKAVRTPMRGVEFPFQIFSIEKDESGLCGQGIPRIMRDPHRAYNATIRSMMDNAALTSGPIVGINVEALRQGEDPDDLYARRILKFDDGKDMREALIFWQAQSHTSEFLAMAKHFEDVQDVLTVPRWVHGDGNVSDAAKTLGGLSMLMGAMSINLAEMVKTFDDDVTSQFITALYFWNMDFNPRSDIKGDFNVVATGSTALMQKEVQSQRLMQFLSLASQPELAGMINFTELLKEIAVSMQVPAKLVNDEATIRQNQQRQMVMQVQAEQQSQLETLLNEMHSRGIAPDVSLQQLLARVLEQAAGGQGAAGPGQTAPVAGMPDPGQMAQALPAGSEGEPGRAA